MLAAAHHHLTPQEHANEANHFSKNVGRANIPKGVVDMPDDPDEVGQSACHSKKKYDEIATRMLR